MSQTPYSKDMVEEIRAYNSTLTRAGTRSRPAHGNTTRGRGSGFGTSPARPSSYTSTGPTQKSVPTNYGMLGNHAVTAPWTVPARNVDPSIGTNSNTNPWAVPSAVTARQTRPAAAVTSSFLASSVNANVWAAPPPAAIEAVKSRITAVENQVTAERAEDPRPFEDPNHPSNIGREPIRTNWVQNREGSVQPQITGTNFVYPGLRPFEDPNHPDNIGKEPIRTNWGPDPVGPIIEGHLKQKSAKETIQEISAMIGIPYEQLTSDDVSIPAIRPHQQATSPAQRDRSLAGVTNGGLYVDSFMSHRMQNGGNRQPLLPLMPPVNAVPNNSLGRSFDIDVEMEGAQAQAHDRPRRGLGNLSDSIWNTPCSPPELPTVTPAPIGATSSLDAWGNATGTSTAGQANRNTAAAQPPVGSVASTPIWGSAVTGASAQSQAPGNVIAPTTSSWSDIPPARVQSASDGWSGSVSQPFASSKVALPGTQPSQTWQLPPQASGFSVPQGHSANAYSAAIPQSTTQNFALPRTQELARQVTHPLGGAKPVKGLKDSMWA